MPEVQGPTDDGAGPFVSDRSKRTKSNEAFALGLQAFLTNHSKRLRRCDLAARDLRKEARKVETMRVRTSKDLARALKELKLMVNEEATRNEEGHERPSAARPERDLQLLRAISQADALKVRQLIKDGANVNAVDENGTTALELTFAADVEPRSGGHEFLSEVYLRYVDDSRLDENKSVWEIDETLDEMRRELVRAGAVIDVIYPQSTSEGQDALKWVFTQGPEILQKVHQPSGQQSAIDPAKRSDNFCLAITAGRIESVKYLIRRGYSVTQGDLSNGTLPLTHSRETKMAKLLLGHGAQINGNDGEALLRSVLTGNTKLIDFYLEENANINQIDEEGRTIL
jgi:hypothetical protein